GGAHVRRVEPDLLPDRLARAHPQGIEYRRMAVVARQHFLLGIVERALAARGIAALRLKGSGFYRRNEVRDVYHALMAGVDPLGSSLTAFLRGPFAALTLADLTAVSNSRQPLEMLSVVRPDAAATIEQLRRIV